jgi:hypothetical protein
VSSLAKAGERILMVMHSYGGAVGTDAVQGLAYPYTPPSSPHQSPGGVIHLLYLCAYILQPGVAIWDIVQEAGFDKIFDEYVHTAEDKSTFPRDPGLMFFGGDESVENHTIEEALKTLVRFPKKSLTTPTAGSAWRHIPATYVLTRKDYGVPRVYQDIMIAKVKNEGVALRTEDFDTCHSIFISREKDMVRLAVETAHDKRNVLLLTCGTTVPVTRCLVNN